MHNLNLCIAKTQAFFRKRPLLTRVQRRNLHCKNCAVHCSRRLPYSACLPVGPPACPCLTAHLPACLPVCPRARLPACLPAGLPACWPANRLSPTRWAACPPPATRPLFSLQEKRLPPHLQDKYWHPTEKSIFSNFVKMATKTNVYKPPLS